jgi:hypothetical protein
MGGTLVLMQLAGFAELAEFAEFGLAASSGLSSGSPRAKDRAVAAVVDALLRAGDVLLDIGPNDAPGVLAAAQRVGPLGHVHVFEAPDTVLQEAGDEIARAGLAHVTLHELALSQANGHTQRFIAPLVDERPFAVRIDLDAAEPGVLASLPAFEHLRFVVVHGADRGRNALALYAEAGLVLFTIRRSALRCRLERIDSALVPPDASDVLAVHPPHASFATGLPSSMSAKALAALLDA